MACSFRSRVSRRVSISRLVNMAQPGWRGRTRKSSISTGGRGRSLTRRVSRRRVSFPNSTLRSDSREGVADPSRATAPARKARVSAASLPL